MKRIASVVLALLLVLNSSAIFVSAQEFGRNSANDKFPPQQFMDVAAARAWMGSIPKVWTGVYDGNSGATHVRRSYVLKITSLDKENQTFKGIGFVDRYPNSKHPELQERGSYNVEGTFDPDKREIAFRGTTFIQPINNFDFVKFTAVVSDNLREINGTTDAWDGSEVHLKAAESTFKCAGTSVDTFDIDENEMNPYLAENCVEYSLLAYKEARLEESGYYVWAKGCGDKPLYDKLYNEGFEKKNIKHIISAKHDGDLVDSIHWYLAHKPLKDGTELVYVILRGTYQKEWYGDFNVTGTSDEYNKEYEGMHYSFQSAAEALVSDINKYLKDEKGNPFEKVKYVVTGHSRGAAVANIASKLLTDKKETDSSIKGVYGYTFATPTVISLSKTGSYTNIFNFCLDDDFVTYMPLQDGNWQYGRYGTTYYSSAARLYQQNSYFKGLINNYRKYDNEAKLSYKKTGAVEIADYVLSQCYSLKEFYEKKYVVYKYSWQNYFYNVFANLMYDKLQLLLHLDYFTKDPHFDIMTSMILVGGIGYGTQSFMIAAYLGTHDCCNYYAMVKCMLDDPSVISTTSDLRLELSTKYPYDESLEYRRDSALMMRSQAEALEAIEEGSEPDEAMTDEGDITDEPGYDTSQYNESDVDRIKWLLENEDNVNKTDWDPGDPSTWTGVTWEDSRITAVDISGFGLSGELDLSDISTLRSLDVSGNMLTYLNINGCPLEELYCEGNLLELDVDSELRHAIEQLDENGGFVYSAYPQGISENAEFDSAELSRLKDFAQTGSNLDALNWTLDIPASYDGVSWTRIGDVYHVQSIELSEKGLTGEPDFSGFPYLTDVDLSTNELISINVSGCDRLNTVNVSSNLISHIDYSNSSIQSLFCDHNYINGDEYEELVRIRDLGIYDDDNFIVALDPQFNFSSAEAFDEDELRNIKTLISDMNVDIDWEHPGSNEILEWEEIDGKYHLSGLDLSNLNITGESDLRMFGNLGTVSFENTDVETVYLPQSVTSLKDRAFAGCTSLNDLYICDTWNAMGTDVFRNCPNVKIHCTGNCFADIVSEALDIEYDEIVALDYITVSGNSAKVAYKGEDYSLNGATIIAHYTDGTEKEITEGFTVSNYDKNKIGTQTIKIGYTDGDYTREIEFDITVYGKTSEGIIYEENGNDIAIRGYEGSNAIVNIPSTIEDRAVTLVKEYAFENNPTIEKVSLPASVKLINNDAFRNCKSLTVFNMEEGLQEIGNRAFYGCNSLKEFIMPDSISSLGTYIFRGCTSLEHVRLNNSRVNITEGTFYDCSSLKKVDCPETVENIRWSAFYGCSSLVNFEFPPKLKLIEGNAFWGSGLASVIIPDSVTSLGSYAFSECKSLKSITLPGELKTISYGVFANTDELNDIRYNGTIEGWKGVNIDSYNNEILLNNRIFCIKDNKYYDNTFSKSTVTGIVNKTYTGKAITQKPVVKKDGKTLTLNTDYKVEYSNNVKVGTAEIIITGIGAYGGSINKTFKINPKSTTLQKPVALKKGFTAKWTKRTVQTTGYQLQYSTSSSFKTYKNVWISKTSTVSKKVTKLKAKKKYYIRIRTYKLVDGTKYYSAWSAKKSVTTKK